MKRSIDMMVTFWFFPSGCCSFSLSLCWRFEILWLFHKPCSGDFFTQSYDPTRPKQEGALSGLSHPSIHSSLFLQTDRIRMRAPSDIVFSYLRCECERESGGGGLSETPFGSFGWDFCVLTLHTNDAPHPLTRPHQGKVKENRVRYFWAKSGGNVDTKRITV